MTKKYAVKMTSDAVGFYVVEMVGDIEMYIKGTSYSRKEMEELAENLSIDDSILEALERTKK
jgi:hypothetical protein